MNMQILKTIKNLFKKKRVVVSLDEFHNRVGEIAKRYGENYYSVYIERSSFEGLMLGNETFKTKTLLKAYINGFGHVAGLSVDEVCQKLIDMKEKPAKSTDIEVEIYII